jgi:UDP-glucose 4-epimerase
MIKKIKSNYLLVTGGAGYIGSKVCNDLIDQGYKVVVIDDLSTGNKLLVNKKAKFFKIDIKDKNKIDRIFNKFNFSTIFHFAASLSVPESEKNPFKYYKNNVLGTENILKQGAIKGIKYFLFSSTCAVYGSCGKEKINESDPTLPESNYGRTKLLAEDLINNYAKQYKFKYAILRYFNVVGADFKLRCGQLSKGALFKNISANVAKNIFKVNVYGNNYDTKDGTCIRDYIDVNDLSELHILSYLRLKKFKSFTINCGYNIGYSVLDIITNFNKIINKDIKIKFLPRRTGDVEKIYCDNSFLRKIFPKWKKSFDIEDSIKNAIAWERITDSQKF